MIGQRVPEYLDDLVRILNASNSRRLPPATGSDHDPVTAGDGIAVVGQEVSVDLAAASGLEFSAGDLVIGTPSTVSAASVNSVTGATHSHDVDSSANPGAAATLLQTNASGRAIIRFLHAGPTAASVASEPYFLVSNVAVSALPGDYNQAQHLGILARSNNQVGLGILAGTGSVAMLDLGDLDGLRRGGLEYLNASDTLQLRAGGLAHLAVQSNGDIRSDDYAAGSAGWNISDAGTPEIAHLYVRGNVGIGIASALRDLHVVGDAVVEGSSPGYVWRETDETDRNWRLRQNAGRLQAYSGLLDDLTGGGTIRFQWLDTGDFYLHSGAIRSDNYAAGSAGWSIPYGGQAELAELSVYSGPVGSSDYVEATTGWRVTEPGVARFRTLGTTDVNTDLAPDTGYLLDLGTVAAKWRQIRAAELWVDTLIAADVMATVGGRILVGPTTELTRDLDGVATTIYTKHNNLASGDRALLEGGGSVEWLAITSSGTLQGEGDYAYTVTRNLDGSGANTWTAGSAVFNTGATGDGFLDLYADQGVVPGSTAGPTVAGMIRQSATWSDIEPRWALGNLDGWYGYTAATYGLAAGDPGGVHVTVEATNGLRILDGATERGRWATDGSLRVGASSGRHVSIAAAGSLQIMDGATERALWDSSGNLRIGTTADSNVYISSAGLFLRDGSTNTVQLLANGDLILGEVATDKANLFWDQDVGRLNFRGGTGGLVTAAWIDTAGQIVAGNGAAVMGQDGLILDALNGEFLAGQVNWRTGGTSYLTLGTDEDLGTITQARIEAGADLLITGSASIVIAPTTVLSLQGNTTITGWLETSGGLIVGSTAATPTADEIRLYSAGSYRGRIYTDANWLRFQDGLSQNVYTPNMMRADGGFQTDTAGYASIGVAGTLAAGDLRYTGALYARRSAVDYGGYIYVPLADGATVLNGVTRTGSGSETINFATYVPSQAAAVNVRLAMTSATAGRTVYLWDGTNAATTGPILVTQNANRIRHTAATTALLNSGATYTLARDGDCTIYLYVLGYYI